MKKTLFVLAAVLTLAAALGAAGFAYAQAQTPPQRYGGMMGGMMNGYGQNSGPGQYSSPGYGHMGGFGGMMNGSYGPMHAYMVDALADALDLTPEALQERIEAGESMWEIAAAEGLTNEEIVDLLQTTHNLAIEQAVADGVITPEQAEWMNSHMQQMFTGGCHGTGTQAPDGPTS